MKQETIIDLGRELQTKERKLSELENDRRNRVSNFGRICNLKREIIKLKQRMDRQH